MKKWKRGLKRLSALFLAALLAGNTVHLSAFAVSAADESEFNYQDALTETVKTERVDINSEGERNGEETVSGNVPSPDPVETESPEFTEILSVNEELSEAPLSIPEPGGTTEAVESTSFSDIINHYGWTELAASSTALSGGSYYLGGDVDLGSNPLIISGTVNLCLNGNTLGSTADTQAIEVASGGTLNLCDCSGDNDGKITNAANNGIFVNGGTLNLYSGTVSPVGSGVSLTNGTFNMYGGTVSTSVSESVNLNIEGGEANTLNLIDGTISGTSKISINAPTTLQGNLVVGSGESVNFAQANAVNLMVAEGAVLTLESGSELWIYGGAVINNGTVIDNGAIIYTSTDIHAHNTEGGTTYTTTDTQHTATTSCKDCPIGYQKAGTAEPHSTGAEGDRSANCEDEAYCSVCQKEYGEADLANHSDIICTLTGSTIAVTCENCGVSGTVILAEPTNLVYDGTEKEASVTVYPEGFLGEPIISYAVKNGAELDYVPVDTGSYIASITLGDKTARVEYTITQAALTVTGVTAEDRTYDGTNAVTISEVTLDGVNNNDDVSVNPDNLTGTLDSANAGTYDYVTLPELTLEGTDAVNYELVQPTGAVETTTTLTINKAQNPSNMPERIKIVFNNREKISDVPLRAGWEWQDADKDKVLAAGTPVTATAVYIRADRDNYINTEVTIAVTRLDCNSSKHGSTEVRGYVAATCTSGGYTGDTYCKDCGTKISIGTATGATGHDYESTVTKEPTTETTGIRTYTCSGCSSSYTEVIQKLPKEDSKQGYKKENEKLTTEGPNDKKTGEEKKENQPVTDGPFIKDITGREWTYTKSGWDVIRDETAKAEDSDTILVDMNGTTVVPGDIFNDIKGRDVTIVFDMGNSITWSVNGKNIISDNVGDIDFSIKVGTEEEPLNIIPLEEINKAAGERYFMDLSITYDGEFGFTAVLSLNADVKNAGSVANLYYFNEQTKEFEFICADEVAEDGTVELTYTHASEYVIIMDEVVMEASPNPENTPSPIYISTENDEESPWGIIGICIVLAAIGLGVFNVMMKRKEEDPK